VLAQTRNMVGALAIGVATVVSPLAVSPVMGAPDTQQQEGLVNVALVDVVSGNNIGVLANVPIGVAANVCGVSAAVLLAAAGGNDPACTARVTQEQANQLQQDNRTSNPNRGGQEPRQEGLVNVALVDVVSGNNIGVLANVPVGVAANVCGVSSQ
jgi:hypothetical protein